MVPSLFGPSTLSSMLRGGLEETSATQRGIGQRVANALQASTTTTPFGEALTAEQGRMTEADLQREMVSLADTQLRYEAEARLLQEAYARFRTAVRSNG